ncbi:MAG: MBL fold metallo-hydrolase [Akkermansiaceae bacterium]|nr:MBL fold metallo-hydrolase [Akkermansiaceae bacterium]
MGAASLAAAGLSGSAHAQEGKPQGESKEADSSPSKQLELLFLGTGAANWPRKYPFKDKKHSRAEVRAMSSILVNGKVLIDCGPTVLDVMKCYEVNPAGITDILLTHTHSDHLHSGNIMTIANSRDAGLGPLKFWGDPEALKKVPDSDRIEKRPVEVGKSFQVHGLEMTGLAANHHVHGSKEQCLIYLIEGAKRRALYATDTAWLPTSTWLHIKNKKLDAIIWDATVGEGKGDSRVFSHNDLAMIRHMNQSLVKGKALKPDAKIILTHIADRLHPPHDVLEKKLLPEGLIPAYEGMSVVLG